MVFSRLNMITTLSLTSFLFSCVLINQQANAEASDKLHEYEESLSKIKIRRQQLLEEISKTTVYKMHFGMTVNKVLDTYPKGTIRLVGGGKDAAGNFWRLDTKNIEEIRKLKFGPYQGRATYSGELFDPKTDRNINFKLSYDGLLTEVTAQEGFDGELNCTVIEKKLRKKYGNDVTDAKGNRVSGYSASEKNSLTRSWLSKKNPNAQGPGETIYSSTQLTAIVSGCVDAYNGSSIGFKLGNPYFDYLSSQKMQHIGVIDKQKELLKTINRGTVPDF